MTPSPDYWISKLELQAHPEGGFFRETYRCAEEAQADTLPARFGGGRSYCTAIYFLLRSNDRSLFHKIKSDEIWHFYAGGSLTIYILNAEGLSMKTLGSPLTSGGVFQVVVPANSWFGAIVNERDGYVLTGCTVSPGFDFKDFQMAKRTELLGEFPDHVDVITKLTI
jgi:uncharacterized protein